MQQFACVDTETESFTYLPLHGFTAVDLGYQKGNAISNFINKIDNIEHSGMYLKLFDQIWQNHEKVEDITAKICETYRGGLQ